MIKEKQNYNL